MTIQLPNRPLSDKQITSYVESNKRINIWEGSVRSGKSFISILRFIKELRSGPDGHCMIIGPTRESIQRNVVAELCGLLGFPVPTPKASQIVIFDRIIYLVGASDERAQRRIQGSTLSMAYVDEISLIPHGFVKMLLSRLSIEGARLFATTNPDSPFHWLKTEFLDNPLIDLVSWKFRIEDNPSLGKNYINALKNEYQGLWYKRYIEGDWVLADGCVYDFFDESEHVMINSSKRAQYYILGVDYGTSNPTVFTLVGYNSSNVPNIWLESEYYYDSRAHNRQKTDTEYAEDLISFIRGYNVQTIYIDPSAASFKLELSRQGIDQVSDADNDVINGIRFVSQLLSNGAFKIYAGCRNTIKEFGTYVWDVKASEKGEDRPVKKHDHCFVAGTKILTESGNVSIEKVTVGDMVWTRQGLRMVMKTFENDGEVCEFQFLGKKITCTPSHKFYTTEGMKEAQFLESGDQLIVSYGFYPNNKCHVAIKNTIKELKKSATLSKARVYNLHVEEPHEYFAEGFLVSNCLDSLRYALFTHFGDNMSSNLKPEDIDRMYYEANNKQNLPSVFQQPQYVGNFY